MQADTGKKEKPSRNATDYIVACIDEFAERRGWSNMDAYSFLEANGGLAFLFEHYEAEHLLSFDEVMSDLETVCSRREGVPA